MKLKILAIMLAAVTLFSCQKKETEPVVTEQEVTFSATLVQPDQALKSTDVWECKDLSIDYALINIDDSYMYVNVYTVGGVLYTQAIKLTVPAGPAKTFTVSEFYLMHQNGTKDPVPLDGDDEIVYATPTDASPYKVYVSDPVDVTFELDGFQKVEVPIEVLCFQDNLVQQFGFTWFNITEIVIREQCFFGDICVTDPELYYGSLYEDQTFGIQIDMPAIFYIDVFRKVGVDGEWIAVPYSPFGNGTWSFPGEGAPLCIEYPDELGVDDYYHLDLYVLIYDPDVNDIVYVKYDEWEFQDDELIPNGGDGVVDFVIGDCNLIPPDEPYDPDDHDDPIEPVCETAYAYGGAKALCFLNAGYNFNRWGWTNGPLAEGTYSFAIWAGAGQCNLANGSMVGSLDIVYTGGNVTVTYNILPDTPDLMVYLYGVHIYVGNTPFPLNNQGNPTVSFNNFTYSDGEWPKGEKTFPWSGSGYSGNIYVIAHGVVCGTY